MTTNINSKSTMHLLLTAILAITTVNCSWSPTDTATGTYKRFLSVPGRSVTTICPNQHNRNLVSFLANVVHGFYTPSALVDTVLDPTRLVSLRSFRRMSRAELDEDDLNAFKSTWFTDQFCSLVGAQDYSLDKKIISLAESYELLVGPHLVMHKFNDTGNNQWTPDLSTDLFLQAVKQAYNIDPANDHDELPQVVSKFDYNSNLKTAVNNRIYIASQGQNGIIPDSCKALIVVDATDRQYANERDWRVIADRVSDFFINNQFSSNCCGNHLKALFLKHQQRLQAETLLEQQAAARRAQELARTAEKERARALQAAQKQRTESAELTRREAKARAEAERRAEKERKRVEKMAKKERKMAEKARKQTEKTQNDLHAEEAKKKKRENAMPLHKRVC